MLPDVLFWGIIATLVVVLGGFWVLAMMDFRKFERHNKEIKHYWARRHVELTNNKRAHFKGVNREPRNPR